MGSLPGKTQLNKKLVIWELELRKLPGMQHGNLELENMEERLRDKTKFYENFQHASHSFPGKRNRKK